MDGMNADDHDLLVKSRRPETGTWASSFVSRAKLESRSGKRMVELENATYRSKNEDAA